jgi:acetyl esterase
MHEWDRSLSPLSPLLAEWARDPSWTCKNVQPVLNSNGPSPFFMSSHHTNPRSLLNAATRSLIERVERAGRPPMAAMSPDQARAFYDIGGPMLDLQPAPHVDRVENINLPARDGHVMPARLYAPRSDAALPVLLYIHGGGFSVGSLTTHDVLCRQLSRQGHCAVVSLDYRLAPEHRFPTAVHDSWDALNWLQQHGRSLGLDTTRLAVGGDCPCACSCCFTPAASPGKTPPRTTRLQKASCSTRTRWTGFLPITSTKPTETIGVSRP